jgi:ATP-binding cassette, subfamily C, bacterial CydC
LARRFTPRGPVFNLALLAATLEAISAVALLSISAYLISRASEQPPIMYLMVAVVGVRAAALGRASFRYLQRLGLHDAVLQNTAQLRPALFEKLSNIREVESKENLELVTTDLDTTQDWTLRVLGPVLQAVVAVVTGALLISVWFPLSGLFSALIATLMISMSFVVAYLRSRQLVESRGNLAGELRSDLITFISASELMRSYELAHSWMQRIREKGLTLARIDAKTGVFLGLSAFLLSFGAILSVFGASIPISYASEWTLPHMIALAILTPLAIFDVASNIQQSAIAMHRFVRARGRIDKVLDAQGWTGGTRELTRVELIEFNRFARYGVSQSFSGSIRANEVTLLRGDSGAGKSSLALGLCGLIEYTGSIHLDGVDLSTFSQESVRRKVILIEQNPRAFIGTVFENLAISGVEDLDRQRSELMKVGLWQEIESRGGLDLALTEGGSNISGGQLQRLAIARALLTDAQLLILDEPTSGLDFENAQKLAELVQDLSLTGLGFLVITHDRDFAQMVSAHNTLEMVA